MNIRNATQDDIPLLGKVYVEAFREVDASEKWTEKSACELISFFMSTQPDLAFLVEVDGRISGGISGLIKPWWDGNHLVETELFVAPWCQKQGVGRKLFAYFLEVARARYHVTLIESLTFKDLDFPLSWYLQIGFETKKDWQVICGNVEDIMKNL